MVFWQVTVQINMHEQSRRTRVARSLTSPGTHWVRISALLYAIACCLPAIKVYGEKPVYGWFCLLVTFSELIVIPYLWPNLLFFACLIAWYLRACKLVAVFSSIAVVLAVSFELQTIWNNEPLYSGCIVWVTSLQILAANAIWQVWDDYQLKQNRAMIDG